MKKKILLVDDHEIFRNGVKQLLDKEANLEVVAEASDGYEAIEKTLLYKPDLVLMDISMPNLSGIDAAKQLLKKDKNIKILLVSLYDKEEYVVKALNMGACGYVLKDESNKVFVKAVQKIVEGDYYYSGDISHTVIKRLNRLGSDSPAGGNDKKEGFHLSKREVQILTEIGHGKSNKVISESCNVSIRTIETHRLNIMRKLRASTIEEAVSIARTEELI